jgi:hypothetical protein
MRSLLSIAIVLAASGWAMGAGAAQVPQAARSQPGSLRYALKSEKLPDGSGRFTRFPALPRQARADETCTLPAPTLLAPADTAHLDTLIPNFSWNQVSAEVFRYDYQLALDPAFSSVVDWIEAWVEDPDPGMTAQIWTFDNLSPDTLYYWHVASECEDRRRRRVE